MGGRLELSTRPQRKAGQANGINIIIIVIRSRHNYHSPYKGPCVHENCHCIPPDIHCIAICNVTDLMWSVVYFLILPTSVISFGPIEGGCISVVSHGAKGDGDSDDTAAFIAAAAEAAPTGDDDSK